MNSLTRLPVAAKGQRSAVGREAGLESPLGSWARGVSRRFSRSDFDREMPAARPGLTVDHRSDYVG